MKGMWSPLRRHSSSYMSDWADIWLRREDGWASKISELAGFNPLQEREIRKGCTVLEIATTWKTMKALSDYAWNDGDV